MFLGKVSHVENVVDLEMVSPVDAEMPVSVEVSAPEMADAE